MNKKGFTLVELLAVVAILAVIVIIALPNVMGMFNKSKENTFTTELKNIYRTAESQWISESMFDTEEKVYSRCKSGCTNPLNMSGREELEYYIKLDKSGKVVKFYATDGTYQFEHNGDLLLTNIQGVEKVADLSESEIVTVKNNKGFRGEEPVTIDGEIFIAYDGNVKIGEEIPRDLVFYRTQEEATNVSNRPTFLKHVVRDNIITESYVGFIINGTTYFVQGGMSSSNKDERKEIFDNIFSHCFTDLSGTNYHCETGNIKGTLYGDNFKGVSVDRAGGCYIGCRINADGSSSCDPEDIAC